MYKMTTLYDNHDDNTRQEPQRAVLVSTNDDDSNSDSNNGGNHCCWNMKQLRQEQEEDYDEELERWDDNTNDITISSTHNGKQRRMKTTTTRRYSNRSSYNNHSRVSMTLMIMMILLFNTTTLISTSIVAAAAADDIKRQQLPETNHHQQRQVQQPKLSEERIDDCIHYMKINDDKNNGYLNAREALHWMYDIIELQYVGINMTDCNKTCAKAVNDELYDRYETIFIQLTCMCRTYVSLVPTWNTTTDCCDESNIPENKLYRPGYGITSVEYSSTNLLKMYSTSLCGVVEEKLHNLYTTVLADFDSTIPAPKPPTDTNHNPNNDYSDSNHQDDSSLHGRSFVYL